MYIWVIIYTNLEYLKFKANIERDFCISVEMSIAMKWMSIEVWAYWINLFVLIIILIYSTFSAQTISKEELDKYKDKLGSTIEMVIT